MLQKEKFVYIIIFTILLAFMLGGCSRFRRGGSGSISKAPPDAPTVEKEIIKIEEAQQVVGALS